MLVPFEKLKATAKKAFLNMGLSEEQAETCAHIHASSSADGVESHGMNRVPRFAEYVSKGWVNIHGKPELLKARGAAENYDGHLGIGITNALFCSERAMKLADVHGIGLVALRNTTHWMRGGTYAWKMAEAGYIGISWINTEAAMPLWGSDEKSVGNNPLCIAIPREDGQIVVDMAMSQYAYGKLGVYRLAGKKLPYPGGFDKNGNLTDDPAAIAESMRLLPTGYWKGSALAIALDLAAAAISNGLCGSDMDANNNGSCTGCSQIFIAIDPYMFGDKDEIQNMLNRRVKIADNAHPIDPKHPVKCPGESTIERRRKSMKDGVHIEDLIWEQVCALAEGKSLSGHIE
ncbi:MAG: 3-dehydro-L-gulonate 2-dehydrogenase [Synergistaceae bacterium]|nr:3-dehydro-L-gulonate 2-dehydrogenase [Synergistaceae bacterium]